ncbi:MAG: hypothetical protein GY842_23135 [bacterium]|nr:hypothetical protein [bacterium]
MAVNMNFMPTLGDATQTQQWLDEARETGQTDTYSRKYRDPRTTWNVPLEIHLNVEGGLQETWYVTSCDISEGGVGFKCRSSVAPYTQVMVCRAGEMVGVTAATVSCTQTLGGFLIGCEFRAEQEAAAVRVSKAG